MLFPPDTLSAIADGRIDLAFRRWERPRVKPGGTQRTSIGVVAFDEVEPVARDAIGDDEARRAGFDERAQLLAFLDRRQRGDIYRVTLRLAGPDPRVALRQAMPEPDEAEAILRRLARLDAASSRGAWTRDVLELIAAHPEERAADLAAGIGRERMPFKLDVRKLKELGLTESLPIGYRLSPRGRAILNRLAVTSAGPRQARRRSQPSQRPRPAGR
jgi:hypothetical protein